MQPIFFSWGMGAVPIPDDVKFTFHDKKIISLSSSANGPLDVHHVHFDLCDRNVLGRGLFSK